MPPPPQQISVAALGRIEPQGRVVDVATSENGRLDRLLVSEGDQVKAGDILAYLDLYDVRLAERDFAASELLEARALLEAETSAGQAQIQERVTRISQLDRPQAYAIDAQKAEVESLRAELNLAQLDLNRTQQLFQRGAIAEQDLDRQQAAVERLTQDLENAIATQLRLETNRTADLDNALAQVETAEAKSATLPSSSEGGFSGPKFGAGRVSLRIDHCASAPRRTNPTNFCGTR